VITRAELQLIRSLRDKKHREELGLYAVEGRRWSPSCSPPATPSSRSTQPRPGRATRPTRSRRPTWPREPFPTPSPVLAVGRIRHAELAPGELERGLTLALDGVQDPGNVGTIIRIADWFGIDRVLLSPGCADLHSRR